MEWITSLLSSDVFRGSALGVAVVLASASLTLQLLKNKPIQAKLDDDARSALDAATQAELRRQAERLDAAEKRHSQCEEDMRKLWQDYSAAQRTYIDKMRTHEEEIGGLRRQILQLQESQLRQMVAPETAAATAGLKLSRTRRKP